MGQQGSKGESASFPNADPSAPTMRAWVATAPSLSPTNLNNVTLMTNVPIPEPTRTQVRVKLQSASLNRVDIGRALSQTCSYPAILGTDGAGIVEKVGDESVAVDQYSILVGDKVYFHLETGSTNGTFAEYCVVELSCLAKIGPSPSPIPATAVPTASGGGAAASSSAAASNESPTAIVPNAIPPSGQAGGHIPTSSILSFSEAATMPSAAWTAFIALFDKLKIERGRVIFIDGAAGGVGSYAVQMCKMMGLFVIGTCSTYNVEYLTNVLGVDVVVDYVMDDISDKLREWTQSRGVDYFLELVSPEQGERYAKHIRFGGAMCLVGGPLRSGGNSSRGSPASPTANSTPHSASSTSELLFLNQISVHHVNLNGMHKNVITWPLLAYLGNQCVQMIETKSLTPCYHEVIPFEQCRDALAQLAQGHAKGKIVLRIAEPGSGKRGGLRSRAHSSSAVPPPIAKPQTPEASPVDGDVNVVSK